jgi:hypothetical protein
MKLEDTVWVYNVMFGRNRHDVSEKRIASIFMVEPKIRRQRNTLTRCGTFFLFQNVGGESHSFFIALWDPESQINENLILNRNCYKNFINKHLSFSNQGISIHIIIPGKYFEGILNFFE